MSVCVCPAMDHPCSILCLQTMYAGLDSSEAEGSKLKGSLDNIHAAQGQFEAQHLLIF